MEEFLNQVLFNFRGTAITVGTVIAVSSIGIVGLFFYYLVVKKTAQYYIKKERLGKPLGQRLVRLIASCLGLIFLISAIVIFGLNQSLYPNNGFILLSWKSILGGILIIQMARLIYLFLSKAIENYYQKKVIEEGEVVSSLEDITKIDASKIATSSIKLAILFLTIFLVFQNLQFDPTLLTFYADTDKAFDLRISTIITILIFLSFGQVFIWALTQLILLGYYKKNEINVGTQYAINQLISYFVYVLVILTALHYLKINMTVFWGGLAALLVGVGLGLQQTFNDLFSGLVLLFERGIEVGEILEIDGEVGSLKKIGLRTSVIETRDNITIIVPNSKLVVSNVINWSHYDNKVRFKVNVGVAYGSDTARVKEILLDTAKAHSSILKRPAPFVRFTDFGNSSLDFELLFFSKRFIIIEDVKSDLRFEIDRQFRASEVVIPFPQRDIWIRKE